MAGRALAVVFNESSMSDVVARCNGDPLIVAVMRQLQNDPATLSDVAFSLLKWVAYAVTMISQGCMNCETLVKTAVHKDTVEIMSTYFPRKLHTISGCRLKTLSPTGWKQVEIRTDNGIDELMFVLLNDIVVVWKAARVQSTGLKLNDVIAAWVEVVSPSAAQAFQYKHMFHQIYHFLVGQRRQQGSLGRKRCRQGHQQGHQRGSWGTKRNRHGF